MRGSWLDGSELAIESIPLVGRCVCCDSTYHPNAEQGCRSPCCDHPMEEIVSGRELKVRSVDYNFNTPPPYPSSRRELTMHMPLEDTLGLNLLAANDHQAEHKREHFDAWRLLCLNAMSSPGAGKTSLCVLITKTDLLPYLPVDIEAIEAYIRQVNPRCTVLRVSACSGEGLEAWPGWVRQQVQQQLALTTPELVLA